MKDIKIDDSAEILGKVRLGNNSYLAQGTIVVSSDDSVKIGNSSWILENSVIIGTKDNPVSVGEKTVFGHKIIAIGCEVGDLCEIGNGVIFLPGSKIGNMCILGEGTIIPEGMVIPDKSVVLGRPARILRKLSDDDLLMIKSMRSNNINLEGYTENIICCKGDEIVANIYEFNGILPELDESVVLTGSCEITGDVKIGKNTKIRSGVKIIGNSHGPIIIGDNVDILENSVLHLLPDNQLVIEDNVTIGPGCIIHGTTIGKNSIVEAASIVSDYSEIGDNSLIKSGSLVKQRDDFPNNSIIEGFPAKILGKNKEILKKPDWAIR